MRRGCTRLRRPPEPRCFASRGVRPRRRVRPPARAEAVLHSYGHPATAAPRPSLRWARGGGGVVARPRVPMDRPEPSGGRVRAGHAGMRGRGVRRPCCGAGVPPRAWRKLGRWGWDVRQRSARRAPGNAGARVCGGLPPGRLFEHVCWTPRRRVYAALDTGAARAVGCSHVSLRSSRGAPGAAAVRGGGVVPVVAPCVPAERRMSGFVCPPGSGTLPAPAGGRCWGSTGVAAAGGTAIFSRCCRSTSGCGRVGMMFLIGSDSGSGPRRARNSA